MTKVFVSGASGFIAQHVVKQLIEKGYNVVGSVRSAEKGETLKKNLASDKFEYEIVEDIVTPGAFDKPLENHPDTTVFLHTASPFHFNTTEIEKDLLKPAIEGTKNALTSIKKVSPQITKVVVTSSFAAVVPLDGGSSDSPPLTEESWCPITYEQALLNPNYGYRGSKTFAERTAWDFVKNEKPNFTLNTVNPTLVFGPQAFTSGVKDTLNTSSEMLNAILKAGTDISSLPTGSRAFIDVRDVAKAHIHAFESDVTNFRYLLVESPWSSQDALDVINKNIPSLQGKVAIGNPGSGKEVNATSIKVENSKTRKLLGDFIPFDVSVTDSINQIISK